MRSSITADVSMRRRWTCLYIQDMNPLPCVASSHPAGSRQICCRHDVHIQCYIIEQGSRTAPAAMRVGRSSVAIGFQVRHSKICTYNTQ